MPGRSASSAAAGRSPGRSYSANTKSFIAGKIAGQYQAKGYSKAHAQDIGNKVVGKMNGAFQPGSGSRQSHTAGVVTGRNQGLYGYGLSRATYIGNAVVRKQAAVRARGEQESAQMPTSLSQRSKVIKSLARNAGAMQLPAPTRQLRDRSKIRFYKQVAVDDDELSNVRAGKLSNTPTPGQQMSKIVGYAEGVKPVAVTSAPTRRVQRPVDHSPQGSSNAKGNRMTKIAGWVAPSGDERESNATVDVPVDTLDEAPITGVEPPAVDAVDRLSADAEARREAGATGVLDAAPGEAEGQHEARPVLIEDSDESLERGDSASATKSDSDLGTFNQRVLDEIASLTPRAMKADAKYQNAFDISETELEGVKFLIDYARGYEPLDYFEIVSQLLALKRRSPEELGATGSAHIDALIEFVREIVEAK
ncbi:hypothetical protein [Microbacterium kunmingense]|uniref:hypothetical protein n=1 Tax=Microbacterium kunmingense TaxID=2915939 RepID=UPI003D723824